MKGYHSAKPTIKPLETLEPNWKANIRVVHHSRIRRARLNTLERRKTPRSLLKVTILLLLLVTMTINAFIVWVLVILLYSV